MNIRLHTASLFAIFSLLFVLSSPAQETRGVLREIWTNIRGAEVQDLTSSPNFPDQPILQVLDSEFASPADVGNFYGLRMRAVLTPTVTADYTFWVSGDDDCELWLGEDESSRSARLIATVPGYSMAREWDRHPQQMSAPVRLQGGARYYIEGLMKEHSGGDSLAVAWAQSPAATPVVISGDYLLAPFAPVVESGQSLVVKAGGDAVFHAPRTTATLAVQVLDLVNGRTPTVAWSQVSGPSATIATPSEFLSGVTLTEPGTYLFEVTASLGGTSRSDQMAITLTEPLHPQAGGALTEYWHSVSGDLEDLKSLPTFSDFPHSYALTTNVSTPRRVNDLYGSRTTGFILVPSAGSYQFYLSADDFGEFRLDTGAGLQLQCEVTSGVGLNDYTEEPGQVSQELVLAAGAYPFEILHKEEYSNDFFSLVWRRPNGAFLEEITAEYLAMPPHASEVMASVTEFDSSLDYSVFAGVDQTVYYPHATASLSAEIRRRRSVEETSYAWSQISGPADALIGSGSELKTEVTFPLEGVYRFQISVTTNTTISSDEVVVTVAPELSNQTGFLKREVWFGTFEGLAGLRADANFPNNPDITTRVKSLSQQGPWSSRYGTRVTGSFVVPPAAGQESVDYTFTVFGDDVAEFSISTDETPENLQAICKTDSNTNLLQVRDASQVSAPVPLVPGRRYFIELLHQVTWGADRYGVAWSTEESPEMTLLSASMVESENVGEVHNENVRFYASAGEDRTYSWPHSVVMMEGSHFRIRGQHDDYSCSWSQLSGPEATIAKRTDLSSAVQLTGPGVYRFALKVKYDGVSHSDDVTITVLEPLDGVTGYLTRSVWFDYSERDFIEILQADPELQYPHFEDLYPGVETPRAFTNFYGTRLEGFLTLPKGGDYRFSLVSLDHSTLEIDLLGGEGYQPVADFSVYGGFRQWSRATPSALIPLAANTSYPIRILHKDHASSEHLSLALEGPATNGREILSRGFLSPLRDAPLHNPELTVAAGADQTLLWPQDTLTIAGLAYDLAAGPSDLSYQWTAVSDGVAIQNPSRLVTAMTFPAPGIYEVAFAVSDGQNQLEDRLIVTVLDPLSSNSGGLLREVWTEIDGYRVSDLTSAEDYPEAPDFTSVLDTFETPPNWGADYGQRLRGYFSVPQDGTYELLVASDDQSELWLNPAGADLAGLELVASVPSASGRFRYDRHEEQSSGPLVLQAGIRYAIEVLHKESSGGDYLNVAYRVAGSDSDPVTIPGALLSPPDGVTLPEQGNGLHVNAGVDMASVWPTKVFEISGTAADDDAGPQLLSYSWALVGTHSGESSPVLIHEATSPATQITVTRPGSYTLQLTVTDGANVSSDQLQISVAEGVADGTGSILCEVFESIDGGRVIDLKQSAKFPTAPDRSFRLASTQFSDLGDRYGAVLRGYLHPPVTGAYQFNLTSDDWSEAYLSSDDSPEKKALVCLVPEGMDYDEWRRHPEYQVSAQIELTAGQRYYLEIRHKEHSYRDHMSFAWLTPGEEAFEVIDGAFLSPADSGDLDVPEISLTGPLSVTVTVGSDFTDPGYTATDLSQGDLSDSIRVEGSVDTATAGDYLLRYYVADEAGNEALVASREVRVVVDEAVAGTYTADQSGSYAAEVYTEPTAISQQDATRFLRQASFGPSPTSIARVQELGYEGWIDEQLGMPLSSHLEAMDYYSSYEVARGNLLKQSTGMDMGIEGNLPGSMMMAEVPRVETDHRLWTWWTLSASAEDQLRQRVAFALSEVLVISDSSPALRNYPRGVANYYDILGRNAFGNYRELLQETTLNPMMGIWLTLIRSDQSQPDENLSRETLQLFSLGLNRLNLDGSLQLDAQGRTIPTYNEMDVAALSRAFTGWTFGGSSTFYDMGQNGVNETVPLMAFEEFHDQGEKVFLGGSTIPAGLTAEQDISRSLDIIFDHPNIAPFISRRLIQRLVTSNPSPAYLYRVSSVFVDNGQGERGDMAAVVKAILLDPEARERSSSPTVGKLMEPVMRPLNFIRAFPKNPSSNPPVLGRYMLENTREELAQSPLQSPSVFNFFSPDFQEPGPLAEAGLVAPEFQITTEITTASVANFLFDGVERGFPTYWIAGERVGIDKAALVEAWGRPQILFNLLEDRLLGREMADETKQSLLSVHAAYAGRAEEGVTTILQILSASPEFVIER